MAIKSGFGIEHETHYVKVNGNGRFETSDGDISHGTKYGIKKDYDSTVHTNLEFVSTEPREKPHLAVKKLIKRQKEGNGIIAPFGNVLGTNKSNAGSYHFNMTMPFNTEQVKTKEGLDKYHSKVKQGMRNLRWLQPILLGVIGSASEKSVGNPDQEEGSVRQYTDSFANVGGTGVGENSIVNRQAGYGDRTGNKKLKDWFDISYETRGGHSQETGKYNNTGNDFKLDKNLNRDSYNSNRRVGDFVIKGYENPTYAGNNPKTVEYRFPDTFSSAGVLGLINFVTYAMENGEHTDMTNDAKTEKIWQDALRDVMEEGWNAQVDRKYFEKINEELKLNVTLPQGKRIRNDIGFELINEALHKKNKEGFWVKNYLKDNKKPELHNFNRDAWQYNYKVMLSKDSNLESKTIKFLKALAKIDTSRSNGWMNVEIKDKKIVVRDILTNEMGLEYSAEDYKDILFLLESEGVIRIKTHANGEIDKLKLIKELETEEDIAKIIKRMKENRDFFTDKYGLDDTVEEVRDPAPARQERPETVRPFAPTGTIVRGERPPASEILQVTYINSPDTSFTDLGAMLEDILVESDFTDSANNPLNWKVKFATELKMNSVDVNAVWLRRNDKIFLVFKLGTLPNTVSQNGEEGVLLQWWDVLKENLYDGETGNYSSPTSDTSNTFLIKLKENIKEMFNKTRRTNNNQKKIELSNAGIQTLRNKGVRIVSVPTQKGREYYLVTKGNYSQARQRYGQNLRFINSIPYYKQYKVEIRGNQLTLYKNNQTKQKVVL